MCKTEGERKKERSLSFLIKEIKKKTKPALGFETLRTEREVAPFASSASSAPTPLKQDWRPHAAHTKKHVLRLRQK